MINFWPSGGTGRHKRLKISRSIEHAGSSPASATIVQIFPQCGIIYMLGDLTKGEC
jgi:hypothetical protein